MPKPITNRPAAASARIDTITARPFCEVGLDEASDVVALPNNHFAVVGDSSRQLVIVNEDGEVGRCKLQEVKKRGGLEALAFDRASNSLFAFNEDTGELHRYALNLSGSEPTTAYEKTFSLKAWADGKNKGIEGATIVPKQHSPTGKAFLLIAKEGEPKKLGMLPIGGGTTPALITFDDRLDRAAKDFSGACVHSKTGRLLLVSDESACLLVCKLSLREGVVHATLDRVLSLRDEDGDKLERVEGVTTNDAGDVFVLLENDNLLMQLDAI